MAAFELHSRECPVDAQGDHAALAGARGLPLGWCGLDLAQMFFDAVEVLDLQQHPAGVLGCALFGLKELAPGVGPARGEDDESRLRIDHPVGRVDYCVL